VALPEALLRHFTAMPVRRRAGVYLLLRGETVVYIGQSGDVDTRIFAHLAAGRVRFDSALVMETPGRRATRLIYERALIYAFAPEGNTMIFTPGKRERAVLALLGVSVLDEDRSLEAARAALEIFTRGHRARVVAGRAAARRRWPAYAERAAAP
jgi:hypothetical protein